MKCAIYLRISDDQSGKRAGVDRQRESCEALAERLDWDVVETYVDNDISAYSGKRRPGFEDMLTAIEGGHVQAIVCWHTDRLYRKLKDLVRLLDASSTLEVRTVEGGDIDLSTASGRMIAGILGSVSTNESEHHAERRRAANLQRAVSGAWRREGSRPFGYDNTGTPLEPEASMIRRAAIDILGGKSLHAVAREWNDSGTLTVRGVPWTNLHVRRVLTNPRIAALRVHQGTVVGSGKWESLLDVDTFEGLTAFLSDPSRKNAVAFERRYMLSGVAKCGYRSPDADPKDPDANCGKPLYASHPHGKDRPMAYTCRPNQHLGRAGLPLEGFIDTVVLAFLSGAEVGSGLRQGKKVDVAKLRTQREALTARRSQLGTLFGKGVIDAEALENGTIEINAQIEDIKRQLADAATGPVPALFADAEDPNIWADTEVLIERWVNATPDVKGKNVALLMDVIVHPAPRGVRTFDPDLVEIRWKKLARQGDLVTTG